MQLPLNVRLSSSFTLHKSLAPVACTVDFFYSPFRLLYQILFRSGNSKQEDQTNSYTTVAWLIGTIQKTLTNEVMPKTQSTRTLQWCINFYPSNGRRGRAGLSRCQASGIRWKEMCKTIPIELFQTDSIIATNSTKVLAALHTYFVILVMLQDQTYRTATQQFRVDLSASLPIVWQGLWKDLAKDSKPLSGLMLLSGGKEGTVRSVLCLGSVGIGAKNAQLFAGRSLSLSLCATVSHCVFACRRGV